jgi:hypothetical protein
MLTFQICTRSGVCNPTPLLTPVYVSPLALLLLCNRLSVTMPSHAKDTFPKHNLEDAEAKWQSTRASKRPERNVFRVWDAEAG